MTAVCLLAPVPLEHLTDGLLVCETKGKVAFGSRAFEVFRELDEYRNGASVRAYIYASSDPMADRLEVSWVANFVQWREVPNGTHPDGMTFRPPSTAKYPADNKGYWAGFWEVTDLRQLPVGERIPTGHFVGFKTGKPYKKNFVPEGPLIVAY